MHILPPSAVPAAMAIVHSQSEEPPAWLLERGLREFYEDSEKDESWQCVVCD